MEGKVEYTMLSVRNKNVTPTIWGMIQQMAPVMLQSRLFGVSSEGQAAAIMLKGFELGIGFTASFELIQVIEGRPTLSPRGAMALLHNAPEIKTIKVNRLVDAFDKFTGYECCMERYNGFAYTARFTLADANRAGLVKPNSGWEKYPENMCMWRAVGFCADVVAPDITAGLTASMKMPEAFGAGIDNSGNLEFSHPDAVDVTPTVPSAPVMTLEQLMQLFEPAVIIAANGGKIPQTDAEVNAVAMQLAGSVA